MTTNKYKWILLTTFILLLVGSPIQAEEQGWLENILIIKINPKFSLKMSQEIRCHEMTYMDAYLFNVQGGLIRHLPKNFYVAALYKRENVKIPERIDLPNDITIEVGDILYENRFTLETGWKTKVSNTFDFDCRFRTEFRYFEKGLDVNHVRFRLRLRLKTKLSIGNLHLKPFISTEPFGDTKGYNITRNRFYLGTGIVLGKKVDLIVSYLNQSTRGKVTFHTLYSGVVLNF